MDTVKTGRVCAEEGVERFNEVKFAKEKKFPIIPASKEHEDE